MQEKLKLEIATDRSFGSPTPGRVRKADKWVAAHASWCGSKAFDLIVENAPYRGFLWTGKIYLPTGTLVLTGSSEGVHHRSEFIGHAATDH